MVEPGDIVKTNYGTGPYRVIDVQGHCTCPNYVAQLNSRRKLPPVPPHMHITAVDADAPPGDQRKSNKLSFLNRYLEEDGRIKSVDTDDEIIVTGKAKGQMSLF